MAYGAEAHSGRIWYELVLNHTPTNTNISFTIDMWKSDQTAVTEATSDAMFQTLLTRLSGLANVTVSSSNKKGEFITPATP